MKINNTSKDIETDYRYTVLYQTNVNTNKFQNHSFIVICLVKLRYFKLY